MLIELITKTQLFKLNKEGQEVPTSKSVKLKVTVDTSDILYIAQTSNEKGYVYKKRCSVNINNLGTVTVYKSYEEMNKLKKPQRKPIGFHG